jgi:hypothetical protein
MNQRHDDITVYSGICDCIGEEVMKINYPENEKVMAAHNDAETIGTFLKWAEENKHLIFTQSTISIKELLAKYFDIDFEKLKKEHQEMAARAQGSW